MVVPAEDSEGGEESRGAWAALVFPMCSRFQDGEESALKERWPNWKPDFELLQLRATGGVIASNGALGCRPKLFRRYTLILSSSSRSTGRGGRL